MISNNKRVAAAVTTAILTLTMMMLYGCQKEEPVKVEQQAAAAATDSDANAVTIQKTCPVMGGAIDKSVYTVYKEKKVYFCCPMCKPVFEKNPDKYISKLPQFAK